MKNCPFCNAEIDENANFCLYCMTNLSEKEIIKPKKAPKTTAAYLTAVVLVFALIAGSIIFSPKSSPKAPISDKPQPSGSQSAPSTDDQISGSQSTNDTQSTTTSSGDTTTTPQRPSNNNPTTDTPGTNTGSDNNSNNNTGNNTSNNQNQDSNQNNNSSNTGDTTGNESNTNSTSSNTSATTPITLPSPVTLNGIKYSFKQVTDSTHDGQPYVAAVVTDCTDALPVDVTIPASVNGYPVAQIGLKAFENADMKSIIMPNTVTIIEDYAFEHCSYLKDITFSSKLEKVGWKSFYNCRGIIELYLPKSLTRIEHSCFAECTSLTLLETYATYFDMGAFTNCTGLKTVKLKNTTRRASFNDSAFSRCTSLTDVYCYFTKEQCNFGYTNENIKEATWHKLEI